jgi:hypothetical protein
MQTKNPSTQTNNTTETGNGDIYNDLQKVKEKVYETRDALTQTACDVKDRAGEIFRDSVDNMKDRFADLQDRTGEMEEKVVQYIKSYRNYCVNKLIRF